MEYMDLLREAHKKLLLTLAQKNKEIEDLMKKADAIRVLLGEDEFSNEDNQKAIHSECIARQVALIEETEENDVDDLCSSEESFNESEPNMEPVAPSPSDLKFYKQLEREQSKKPKHDLSEVYGAADIDYLIGGYDGMDL